MFNSIAHMIQNEAVQSAVIEAARVFLVTNTTTINLIPDIVAGLMLGIYR